MKLGVDVCSKLLFVHAHIHCFGKGNALKKYVAVNTFVNRQHCSLTEKLQEKCW